MKQQSNSSNIIKAFVAIGDFALLNAILLFFLYRKPDLTPPFFQEAPRTVLLVANLAMAIAMNACPSIIHRRRVRFEDLFKRVLTYTLLHAALMFIFIRVISSGGLLFRFMFIFAAIMFAATFLLRTIERFILRYYRLLGRNSRSVVFIGSDPSLLMIYKEMTYDVATGYKIAGYYSDKLIADCPDKLRHLGSLEDLNRLMTDNTAEVQPTDKKKKNAVEAAEEIYCSLSHDKSDQILGIMRYCDRNVVHFYYVPRMFGNLRLNLKPEPFGEVTIFTNHHEPLASFGNRFVKRTFDIAVSAVVCLCMLPFLPIIAAIIKLSSPGPILFKQARTGMNGKTFMCYKFRSMHINDEADMTQATLDDPRKFAFGRFMRKTNIDEFPQFFNVLLGDMSIVGPRPHMLHHTEVYSQLIDKYMVRHFSKPGITGWAQVSGFRGETKELWQMEGRIKHDIWYIENWTFWLDIKIIFKTALSLFWNDKNAY